MNKKFQKNRAFHKIYHTIITSTHPMHVVACRIMIHRFSIMFKKYLEKDEIDTLREYSYAQDRIISYEFKKKITNGES